MSPTPNERVSVIHGEHLLNYTNNQVRGIVISEQNNPYLPHGFSAFFENILEFEVQRGGLQLIRREDFRDLKTLRHFAVSHGEFSSLPSDVFNDLVLLESVSFNDCLLETLPDNLFYHQPNLKKIIFRGTKIVTISSCMFAEAQNLELLDLSSNQIETFTPGSAEIFSKVKDLQIDNNPCTAETNDHNDAERIENCQKSCQHVIDKVEYFEKSLAYCEENLDKAIAERMTLMSGTETCQVED